MGILQVWFNFHSNFFSQFLYKNDWKNHIVKQIIYIYMIVQIQDMIIFQKFYCQISTYLASQLRLHAHQYSSLFVHFLLMSLLLTFPKEKVIITGIGHITCLGRVIGLQNQLQKSIYLFHPLVLNSLLFSPEDIYWIRCCGFM